MQPTHLSARQQRFVNEYLVDGNGTQAAIRAGYGRAGSHVAAARLLKNDKVITAVRTGQRELGDRLAISRERVLEGLLQAVEIARVQQDPGSMIRAWSEIGRMCGCYAFEREVKVGVHVAARRLLGQLEVLSDTELVNLMSQAV
jgi:phage terminase small subunit